MVHLLFRRIGSTTKNQSKAGANNPYTTISPAIGALNDASIQSAITVMKNGSHTNTQKPWIADSTFRRLRMVHLLGDWLRALSFDGAFTDQFGQFEGVIGSDRNLAFLPARYARLRNSGLPGDLRLAKALVPEGFDKRLSHVHVNDYMLQRITYQTLFHSPSNNSIVHSYTYETKRIACLSDGSETGKPQFAIQENRGAATDYCPICQRGCKGTTD